MKNNARQFVVLAILTGSVLLVGCVTLETPDTKYVMKKDGFEDVGKSGAQNSASKSNNEEQLAVSEPTELNPSGNKAAAWGVCCRHGRGENPDPMSSFKLYYPLDVDTAYLRIKQAFGFRTIKEYSSRPEVQEYVAGRSLLHFRYEEMPGAHYKMRDFLQHTYGSEESSNTIEVELFKDGANQVKIKIAYYSGNTLDAKGYASSIRQRIERALEGS